MSAQQRPLVVISVVGLTPELLGEHTPHLNGLANDGFVATLTPPFPAVTCTAQSTMLTGALPREHGVVANGWFFRELAEVWLWRQSNRLVQGEKVWDAARAKIPSFRCAQLFWWYNMYARVDYSVTPRPAYPADGRKIPALYSYPSTLHQTLEDELGPFPFFRFWGPRADIASTQWIGACAKLIFDMHRPSLELVYLPHLDYNLQRLGPQDPRIWADVAAVDRVAGELIEHVRAAGSDVIVVSEYGIEAAAGHVDINRVLRENGYIAVRETLGWELLDFGASRAFAVVDHQVAHVYVQDPRDVDAVAKLLARTPGVEHVLDAHGKAQWGIDHPRAGELVAVAAEGRWFTYYYWLEDARAPDFARTVDIHRKPGYDPVELFLDPDMRFPSLKIGWRLLQKNLGFRTLLDVIPLKPELVKGTHGRPPSGPQCGPLLIASNKRLGADRFTMQEVKGLILAHWR